jgi:hypothetical protein
LAIGAAAAAVVANIRGLYPQTPQARPTISPARGYELSWIVSAAPPAKLNIAIDGGGCETLASSDFLYRACVLATNLDPLVIAGEAFGRLNFEPTPAREALIWRAVLNSDQSVCAAGGLAEPYLGECRRAVEAGVRRATDASLTVEISHGDPPSSSSR